MEELNGIIIGGQTYELPKGLSDAPSDGKAYSRKNGGWSPSPTGLADAPSDNKQYVRKNGTWQEAQSAIPDAPNDGNKYVRKNGEWVRAASGGGGSASMASDVETEDGSTVQEVIDDLEGTKILRQNTLQPVHTIANAFCSASGNQLGGGAVLNSTTSAGRSVAFYPIQKGRKYAISVPKTGNSYGLLFVYASRILTGSTLSSSTVSVGGGVHDDRRCTGNAIDYTIENALDFEYICVDYISTSGLPTVTESYYEYTEIGKAEKGLVSYNTNLHAKESYSKAWRELARLNLRPVKILGLGNSWLKNSTEVLGAVFDSLGIKYEIHRLYKSSCMIREYSANTINGDKIFEHSVCKNNTWTDLGNVSVEEALMSDDWDIVTLQNRSGDAGIESKWLPYTTKLIKWINEKCKILPMIFIHSTWAYPNGATTSSFPDYDNDTDVMYEAILNAVSNVMEATGIYNVIPNTPMIQQARQVGITLDLDDGSHLKAGAGYTVAAYLWAETFLRLFYNNDVVNKSITETTYMGGMSEDNAITMRNIAQSVVANYKSYYPCFQDN